MKNRKIEEIVEEYKTVSETASKDINDLPYTTRSSHQNAIRFAKDRLVELRKEYDDRLFSNAYAVVLVDESAKNTEFKNATFDIGGLVFDFENLYRTLAAAVEPSIGFTREFGINQGFMMMQKLEEVLTANGIELKIKDPNIKSACVVPTHIAVVNYIRETLNHTFGTTLTNLYVRANLLHRALEAGHAKKAFAVAFINATKDDILAVAPLFKNMSVLDLKDVELVDQSYAISIFNKLNKKPNKAESHNKTEKESENE